MAHRARRAGRVGTLFSAVALVAAGCGVFGGDGPADVTEEFLGAFASGDTAAAAALTDSPKAAKAALDQARSALKPRSVKGTVHEAEETGENSGAAEASAGYSLEWRLGNGGRWEYPATAKLRTIDGEWKLRWSPSLVHPELGAQQTIALRTEPAPLAPVLDRDGAPLLQTDTVVSVLVDPEEAGEELDSVAGTLGSALNRLDEGITKRSVLEGIKKTEQGKPYVVAALRSADYQQVKPAIYELPGVRFTSQERLLAVDKNLGSQILPAIRGTVQDKAAGTEGWRVVTVSATGAEGGELHSEQPKPAEAFTSTLSIAAQTAAERALDGVDGAAMLVAMEASTGELLAVAQNPKADEQGAVALTGRFPPGSTFKIVTAVAALTANATTADSTVDCPATTTIGDRRIPNDNEFALGKVPLHTAFARSCNTTFSQLAADLPADALGKSAQDLGIGADFIVPGITTITGSAPRAEDPVQRAENGIGQGTVLASPFGMAVAVSTVATGKTPTPSLLRGMDSEATRLGEPVRPEVLETVRTMMREVVTDGTARSLGDLPGVAGKTGTAQFGDGKNAHGWFAGYQGDVAFAVLVEGANSSSPAVDVTRRFLTDLR